MSKDHRRNLGSEKKIHKILHGNERRRATRVKCEQDIDLQMTSDVFFKGRIKNLSLKGAFISQDVGKDVKIGDEVEFGIVLSEINPEYSICGEAKIVRKEPGKGVGIEFIALDAGDVARLRKFLSSNLENGNVIGDDLETIFQ